MGMGKRGKQWTDSSACTNGHSSIFSGKKKIVFKIFTDHNSEYKGGFFQDKRQIVLTLQKSLNPQEWLKVEEEGDDLSESSHLGTGLGLFWAAWCCSGFLSLLSRNQDGAVKIFGRQGRNVNREPREEMGRHKYGKENRKKKTERKLKKEGKASWGNTCYVSDLSGHNFLYSVKTVSWFSLFFFLFHFYTGIFFFFFGWGRFTRS